MPPKRTIFRIQAHQLPEAFAQSMANAKNVANKNNSQASIIPRLRRKKPVDFLPLFAFFAVWGRSAAVGTVLSRGETRKGTKE